MLSEKDQRAAQIACLLSGTTYLTLTRKKTEYTLTLKNGKVVQMSGNAKQMEGWALERVLDWAERCRVTVYASDDGAKRGAAIKAESAALPRME